MAALECSNTAIKDNGKSARIVHPFRCGSFRALITFLIRLTALCLSAGGPALIL